MKIFVKQLRIEPFYNLSDIANNLMVISFLCIFLSSCSTVTDVWDGATSKVGGFFSDEDYLSSEADEDDSFPNLADVPDEASSGSETQRQKAASGLISDSNNSQYTQQVRRQDPIEVRPVKDVSNLEKSINEPPPPIAVPSSPVIQSNLEEDSTSLAERLGKTALNSNQSISEPLSGDLSPSQVSVTEKDPSSEILSTLPSTSPKSLREFNKNAYRVSSLVATINFKSGSSRLDNSDKRIIDEVVKLHSKNGGVIRVTGHASSRTQNLDRLKHKLANFNISMQRANVVATELIQKGIPAGNLYVGAMSDNEPVFYEVMPNGEYGNQRAEIYMDY